MKLPFTLEAVVESGRGLGRRLGAPTVNLNFTNESDIPRYGVYIVRAVAEGREYAAVANVGVRPTVETRGEAVCEVHIMDFSGDLYGKTVRIIFLEYLRPERHFESKEQLRTAIAHDVKKAREYFAGGSPAPDTYGK